MDKSHEIPSTVTTSTIHIYKDSYANKDSVRVGYKGKVLYQSGIIVCPYKKPNIFVRIYRRIFDKVKYTFVKKPKVVDL